MTIVITVQFHLIQQINARCMIRLSGEKKKIPLGKKCEYYYNLSETVDKVIDDLVEKGVINVD
ncbi:hypothetical protein KAU33_15445 [Candidatus Dependentiae bacterium]|nr:hypothetical protein [Candidatus Dependentiae bacterium]